MTSRKKSGVAFWATVVVVVVLTYPLSYGPLGGILKLLGNPDWALRTYWFVYSPMVWVYEYAPRPISDALAWYAELWL